jgi:uncharacterized membrane protein YccF (DUF307 family)
VRVILNIIWLIFAGIWLAIGIASFRLAAYSLWPFGRTMVRKPTAGVGSAIGNILWFILAGWWLAIGHLITSVALAITIIGIPLAWANLKLAVVALTPLGKEIVSNDDPRAEGGMF